MLKAKLECFKGRRFAFSLVQFSCTSFRLKLNGDFLGARCGPAMDPGTMDAGGLASGGRPGLSLLVPVQHMSGLSSLVVDTNSHRSNTGQTTRRAGHGPPMARPGLLGGLVRSAANPESGNIADFSEEEKMKGLKVQSLEDELFEDEEFAEFEQIKEVMDLDPVNENEDATLSPTLVEEGFEEERPAVAMANNSKEEIPMSPSFKLVSKKWNELSRNLPPLGGLRALPPLSRLLRGDGEPLQRPSASRFWLGKPKEMAKPKAVFKTEEIGRASSLRLTGRGTNYWWALRRTSIRTPLGLPKIPGGSPSRRFSRRRWSSSTSRR